MAGPSQAFYAPDPVQSTQLIPGGNTPASGAQLFVYVVGSSTKQNSYTDASASTARTNPIVLDSGGNIPGNGEVWIASSAKFVLAPSNDTDPPVSPYWTRDAVPGINNVAALIASSVTGEWIQGSTATFVGVTAFSLVGDQTALYTLGRRIKAAVTGGNRFGIVTSSVLAAASTAVGVTLDSSTLNGGLSSIQYGLLSTPNGSVPWTVETSTGINLIGSTSAYAALTFISVAHNDAQTTVTSSANPNIWTGGNVINFTGTTTVSSFANAPQAGATRTLLIAGATTVTFVTSSALSIAGGASTYAAPIGDKIDVVATSTVFNTIYPVVSVLTGNWIPSVGGSATYLVQTGSWTKIARLVFIKGVLQINAIGTGSLTTISGLPFPSAISNETIPLGTFSNLATTVVFIAGITSGSNINFQSIVSASTTMGLTNIFQSSTLVAFSGCYQA